MSLRRAFALAVACVGAIISGVVAAQVSRSERLVEQALGLKPDRAAGARTFQRLCSSCHGREAHGNADAVTPALAGQLTAYLIRELVDMAESNRPARDMHRTVARAELAEAQALRDVASFLTALPRLARPQTGDGQTVMLGQRVFDAECRQCHGARAEGDVQRGVPALQGQHYAYLLSQSRQMPVAHGYDVGVETLERFEELTLEELAAVSDYISRMSVSSDESVIARAARERLATASHRSGV
jgi:cytochrome c553